MNRQYQAVVPGDLPTEETPHPVSKRKSVVQPEVTPDILRQRQKAADDYEAALKLQSATTVGV